MNAGWSWGGSLSAADADADNQARSISMATAFPLLASAGLVGAIYWPMFVDLIRVWDMDPNYSHGFAVPAVSLIIAFLAWKWYGPPVSSDVQTPAVWLGLLEIAVGLALHGAAWFAGVLLFDVVSLVLVLRGMLLVVGGRQASRRFGFAVLFLVFMAPLPIAWYHPLAIVMQQLVSGLSTQFLELCGAAVYREGYLIHVPGYSMEVGEACSGLRQLTAILALAICIGYMSGHGNGFRWTLALLSVPIAIAANCVRVMLTGVIMMTFGRQWAEGVFHSLEGFAIVAVASVMVVVAAVGMSAIARAVKNGDGSGPGRFTGQDRSHGRGPAIGVRVGGSHVRRSQLLATGPGVLLG